MTTIILGALVQGMSGKNGTSVFANTKDGVIMRDRKKPSQPNTPGQMTAKSNMSRASALFRAMTPDQVSMWTAYGKTLIVPTKTPGKSRYLTGIQAFNGLTTKFLQFAPTGIVAMSPPTSPFSGDIISLTALSDTGGVQFEASGVNAAGVQTELLLQRLSSQNRTPVKKGYRLKGFIGFAGTVRDITVSATPGWYVPAYRFVHSLTGQTSPLIVLPPVQVT